MFKDLLSGIAGGMQGYGQYLMYQQEQKRIDEAERLRKEEAELRRQQINSAMETDRLQRQALQRAIERQPVEDARADLKNNIEVKGLETTLNDPATLELGKKANVSFPTEPGLLPRGFADPSAQHSIPTAKGIYEMSGADAHNRMARSMGVFPDTGIVKPPEVAEKEVERELSIQRAKAVQDFLGGLGMPGGTNPSGMSPEELNRLRMRMGLGINANEIFGPIRETPEEAAAKASAVATAQAPHQKALIDYARGYAADVAGDPYFNEALRIMSSIIPPIGEAQIKQVVEAAAAMARAAQRVNPRGGAARPPAPVPDGGQPPPPPPGIPPSPGQGTTPPPLDALITQAVETFGGFEAAIAESSKPEVQQKLQAAGIDPAAYLRRMKAMKINAQLSGGR